MKTKQHIGLLKAWFKVFLGPLNGLIRPLRGPYKSLRGLIRLLGGLMNPLRYLEQTEKRLKNALKRRYKCLKNSPIYSLKGNIEPCAPYIPLKEPYKALIRPPRIQKVEDGKEGNRKHIFSRSS